MITIKLPHGIYQYDPNKPLGPKGGFGTVYLGQSANIGNVAIKHISFEAHREITIADELLNKQHEHIIPIFDAGQDIDTGANFIVMAQAERSLQDYLIQKKILPEMESVSTLIQIVQGLLEVPEIVHRDLKPGNILFHSGSWKVADFGIAKFVEESTSLRTLNDFLTPQYAAPEQWDYERATNAVDTYALGCIGFTLLTGAPPFTGSSEDLKQQHLHSAPPPLSISSNRLKTLINMMLRKNPETRPSQGRILHLLEQLHDEGIEEQKPGLHALSEVAASLAEQAGKDEAQRISEQNAEEKRVNIAQEAINLLADIINALFGKIHANAPNAIIQPEGIRISVYKFHPNMAISLGESELSIDFNCFLVIPKKAFEQCGWDVITGTIIKVTQKTNKPYVWSANLWFTNLGKQSEYRWWEVSYMTSAFARRRPDFEPYAVENLSDAALAASPVMAHIQLGSKPKLIDDEFIENFCDRWAELLAKGASGQLTFPRYLPLD